MELIKLPKVSIAQIEQNHPVLFNTILYNFSKLSREEKEMVAALVIESVISSGGKLSIFDEEDDEYFDDEF